MIEYGGMQSVGSLLKYITVSLVFLVLFVANAFFLQATWLGLVLLAGMLLFYGRSPIGAAQLIALLSILGGIAYYLDLLTLPFATGVVIAVPLICFWRPMQTSGGTRWPRLSSFLSRPSTYHLPLTTFFLFIILATTSILTRTEIIEPVRSPWLVIPTAFFIGIFFLALLLASKPSRLTLTIFFLLTISVALLSYPLGYGFDSFIHKATESHILEHGTITPKPLYYAGQYALVLIAAHGFSIPVALADSYLVPLLAGLLLPLLAWRSLKSGALVLFLLPLSSFIATTPQALANTWSLAAILVSIPLLKKEKRTNQDHLALWIFAVAAVFTHPLAGIPIIIYAVLLELFTRDYKRLGYLTAGLGSISLPAIFLLNAKISGLNVTLSFKNIFTTPWTELLGLHLFVENRFHPFLDAAYLFGWNRILILLTLTIAGIIILRRIAGRSGPAFPLSSFLFPPAIMLINYLLLSTLIGFDFLIDYERSNYSARIFEMMQFMLLPILGIVVGRIFEVLKEKPAPLRFGFTLLTAMILTASVYMTYPRHDNYEISRGFNVGQSDFETVRYIHGLSDTSTIDYVVLANQAVSAAAVQEYGFLKYSEGDIFYYPIPTGGPLYQLYLEMVNIGPTRERAEAAMNLADVDTAYFVVNDYWWMSDKVIENAKREADHWISLSNGATTVFTFIR